MLIKISWNIRRIGEAIFTDNRFIRSKITNKLVTAYLGEVHEQLSAVHVQQVYGDQVPRVSRRTHRRMHPERKEGSVAEEGAQEEMFAPRKLRFTLSRCTSDSQDPTFLIVWGAATSDGAPLHRLIRPPSLHK